MFDDCHEAIRYDSNMNLDSDSILIVAVKLFHMKMLLDPFEEQFDPPSIFIKESDIFCRYRQIVGIENEVPLMLFVVIYHSAEILRILFGCFINSEPDALVTHYTSLCIGIVEIFNDLVTHIDFFAYNEEGFRLVDKEQLLSIHISAIKYIERP